MFTSWSRVRGRRIGRNAKWHRLQVLSLEERTVPAQLVVTSAADDGGAGTLRSIVAIANTNGEADTIMFDPAVTTITLATGQLTISEGKNLTIDGGGTVTINGAATPSATNRLFNLTATGTPTIELKGMTLTKGNLSNGNGGAILMSDQVLKLESTTLLSNFATGSGGALFASRSGIVTIDDCSFNHNSCDQNGGAIAASGFNGGFSFKMTGSTILGNSALKSGAMSIGWASDITSTVHISKCQVVENKDNGTIIQAGTISVYGRSGFVFEKSSLINNQSSHCGGIWINGDDDGVTEITNSTIARNLSAGFGTGGLVCNGGALTVSNSTISSNNSDSSRVTSFGAIYLSLCGATISNSTIANNGSSVTKGPAVNAFASLVTVESSIVAGNQYQSGFWDLNYAYLVVIVNNSIIGAIRTPNDVNATNSQIGFMTSPIDPGLVPLGNYGGPTLTMGLKSTSPAINKGSNPSGLLFDQRGQPREVPTGFPDIGAFEGTVAPSRIESVEINDGDPQRSRVTGITVNFDLPIGLPANPNDAFQLKRQSDDSMVATSAIVVGNSVKLSFTAGPVEFGSLADGRYTLTVLASKVTNGYFDGNADGIAGDDYVLVGNTAIGLFRLFGDSNGDGVVSAFDYNAFRQVYNSASPVFDFNNDGVVSAADYQQFRLRYGMTI